MRSLQPDGVEATEALPNQMRRRPELLAADRASRRWGWALRRKRLLSQLGRCHIVCHHRVSMCLEGRRLGEKECYMHQAKALTK